MRPALRNLVILATTAAAGSALFLGAAVPAAEASVPANAVWTSGAPFALWKDGHFYLYNNVWNAKAGPGPQTIWAYSYKHWGVQSTQSASRTVRSYPSVEERFGYPRVSRIRGLSSTFRQSMPTAPQFDAEAAYDLWLFNGRRKIEVMVWVDDHEQSPAGSLATRVTVYRQRYDLYVDKTTSNYSFKLESRQLTSGTIHLLTMLQWLQKHRYLSAKDTLWQVDFGWEICSTDGVPLDFTVTNYSLSYRG
jgi:hypothetical protein